MVKTVASSLSRPAPTLTDLSYASMEGVATPAAAKKPMTVQIGKTLAFSVASGVVTFGVAAAFLKDAALAGQIAFAQSVALALLHYAFEKFWRAPQKTSTPGGEPPPFEGEGL